MKTATVRDLRNRFQRISRWLNSGETVRILKRGRPFARVLPEPQARTFVGACPAALPLPDDLDDPIDIGWEAGD
jgi:antitoxin (DNA-binding transcriptional repressor) of toxin-antitoxin stability system